MDIPDTLKHKVTLFGANGRIHQTQGELFGESSWLQVMFGQHIKPMGYHPLVDNTAVDAIAKMMANVKMVTQSAVQQMPSHQDYIARQCKAAQL
jgi:tryptophan halogenase